MDKDQPWYKKLVTVVTWIELLSASGSVLADKLLKTSAKNLIDEFGRNWPAEFETDSRGAEARQTLNDIAGVATVPISEMFESYKKEVETELKRLEKLDELGTFSSTNPNGTPRHSPEIMTELLELAYKKETPVSEIADLIHINYKNRKLIESEQLLLQVKYFINVTKLKGYPAGFASLEKYEDFCNAVKTELNNILVKFGESYNADFRSIQFELKIQGSSLRKRFLTDPFPEGVDPSDYVGLDVPGDIEFGIFMDEENFESFVRELGNALAKAKGQGKLNSKLGSAINYAGKQSEISNNFLMYIPTEQGNALDAIKNPGFQHITGLPSAADVNFKFFKSGATGGLEPLLEFKY
ncbi:hypothetical protein LX99_03041 [Mucilaginibacter oryzae]|uniref:Uncharacterized protein n=1 Tax=Mucilaginibacter oryzae TaxID=468058 RepID=A0A316HB75_9SPHI|nr:hypothetical protein [Mucilaginibacter oryzae]PWK77230.1 hypothetical protein LX99_03041 [Mucilaginibacter oryzae]